MPSLDDYLLISTDRRRVDHYQRTAKGWVLRTHVDHGALTTSAGVRRELDALYRLVGS